MNIPEIVEVRASNSSVSQEGVTDEELEWMLQHRPLNMDPERLKLDYGDEDATAMLAAFESSGITSLCGVLAWPGV